MVGVDQVAVDSFIEFMVFPDNGIDAFHIEMQCQYTDPFIVQIEQRCGNGERSAVKQV